MDIQPNHQDFLTKNNLFLLHQLPKPVQPIAIEAVMKNEHRLFLNNVENAKLRIKENIHACINNRGFIRQIYEHRQNMKQEKNRRKIIESNLCEFYLDGTYHTYSNLG